MSLSSIPRALRDLVYERDEGRCAYCLLKQFGQGVLFHVDHINPKSNGGATSIENLVLQCPYCSLHKSNKTSAIDPSTGKVCPIFNPLQDRWSDHFVLEQDGTCRALTPLGRATVAALAMNDPLPTIARAVQILIGMDRL